jgi:hypothetical protein
MTKIKSELQKEARRELAAIRTSAKLRPFPVVLRARTGNLLHIARKHGSRGDGYSRLENLTVCGKVITESMSSNSNPDDMKQYHLCALCGTRADFEQAFAEWQTALQARQQAADTQKRAEQAAQAAALAAQVELVRALISALGNPHITITRVEGEDVEVCFAGAPVVDTPQHYVIRAGKIDPKRQP